MNNLQQDLVSRVAKLQEEARKPTTYNSDYDIKSENTAALITAGVNDYDLGNYDVVRLESNGAYTITGFVAAQRGREIAIWNVGGYVLTFSHQSSSSVPANRILSYTGAAWTLSPNRKAVLYYDLTTQRWRYNG